MRLSNGCGGRGGRKHRTFIYRLGILALLLAACSDSDDSSPEAADFRFQARAAPGIEGQFVARTEDAAVIAAARAQLALPEDQRTLFIGGPVARGDGGHNLDWSWHLVPSEWSLVEASIELCDGTPQMVEDDLDYWVDTVGSFCPWTAVVAGEEP